MNKDIFPALPAARPLEIPTGPLITNKSEYGVPLSGSTKKLNCTTRFDDWRLDRRHRRFQSRPIRNFKISEEVNNCKSIYGYGASVFRMGSTVGWTAPSATISEDSESTSIIGMSPGGKSETLKVASMVPVGDIPTGATVTSRKLRIRHRVTGETTVLLDTLRATNDGANIATDFGASQVVPGAWETLEFTLSNSLFTIAENNDGSIGAYAGFTADPTDPAKYNSSNWTVTFSPTGTQVAQGGLSQSLLTTYTITATYTGTAPAPKFVVILVSGTVFAGTGNAGSPLAPTGFYGVATATAFSVVDSGAIRAPSIDDDPGQRGATGTTRLKIALAGSSGTGTVTLSGSSSITLLSGSADFARVTNTINSATVVQPTASQLEVDFISIKTCYTAAPASIVELTGGGGIGFGAFGGFDEVTAVWGESVFSVPSTKIPLAMGYDWVGPQYANRLALGNWCVWQYGKWNFYSEESVGVYFREIGTSNFQGLYKDYQFNGPLDVVRGFLVLRDWRSTLDSVAITATFLSSITTVITTSQVEIRGSADDAGADAVVQFAATWATQEDWSGSDYAQLEIASRTGLPQIRLKTDSVEIRTGTSTWRTCETKQFVTGTRGVDQRWAAVFRLKGVTDTDKVTGIRVSYSAFVQQANDAATLASTVKRVVLGGTYLLANPNTQRIWNAPVTKSPIDYAIRYKKTSTGQVSPATIVTLPSDDSAGDYNQVWIGELGARVTLQSSASTQSPFDEEPDDISPDVIIQFMRKDGLGKWRLLYTVANRGGKTFIDKREESEVRALTEITDLTTDTDASLFGTVQGVVCGCSWKGANVYALNDGKIYFSASNDYRNVLWSGVTTTNENLDKKSAPRTDVLADNISDYALALVPAENLYCLTRREAYVYISGESAATASFPRKMTGARGVVGKYAATVYGDRCVYASDDGIWAVKKTTAESAQPDELTELTESISGSYAWLLGSDKSRTIVLEWRQEIYAFNEDRYLHWHPDGGWSEGQWADERKVLAASADLVGGIVLQMEDGTVSVIGDFPTDGGSNLAGSNGLSPTWVYETGREQFEDQVNRFTINANGTVTITFQTENGNSQSVITGDTLRNYSVPRTFSSHRSSAKTLKISLSGDPATVASGFILLRAGRSQSRSK